MNLDLGKEASGTDDFSKKSSELHLHALEEELKKIEAFKRELPHCMHLLQDVIERLKEEKRREGGMEVGNGGGDGRVKRSNDIMEKKNWMSSVQICTPVSRNPDSVFHMRSRFMVGESSGNGNDMGGKFRKEGGAFWPYKKPYGVIMKEKQGTAPVHGFTLRAPEADVANNELTEKRDFGFGKVKLQQPQQQEQQKKQRRCWSQELHNIFVDALHQIGGAQTATPKQIRELMKVEGLTNDEVKSHLQKYRIHVKRVAVNPSSSAGPLQVAVLGSPQGPLQGSKVVEKGSSAAASVEDDGDDKSESHGRKSQPQKTL